MKQLAWMNMRRNTRSFCRVHLLRHHLSHGLWLWLRKQSCENHKIYDQVLRQYSDDFDTIISSANFCLILVSFLMQLMYVCYYVSSHHHCPCTKANFILEFSSRNEIEWSSHNIFRITSHRKKTGYTKCDNENVYALRTKWTRNFQQFY